MKRNITRASQAAMIDRHGRNIVSYCHQQNTVSLGLAEGGNNKIHVLQRRAYGYRDEDYLKLKIVAAFLPPLTKNVGKDPLRPAETQLNEANAKT